MKNVTPFIKLLIFIIAMIPLALIAQVSNVAKGKVAKHTNDSQGSIATAAKAVDGNTNGIWAANTTNTITSAEGNSPWWEVDLGKIHDISEIKIWNRTDECCWNKLQNFYVIVSEDSIFISATSSTDMQYVQGPLSFSSAAESNKSLKNNVRGRYIRIFIPGDNKTLTLSEVEVFGVPAAINMPKNKGKGLVFDGKSQFVQFPATGFPIGAAARTLEFWVRAVPNIDGKEHYIVNWGEMADPAIGSTFGVRTQYLDGQYRLGFWGHNRDIAQIAVLPDDQWHFVALTYDGSNLRFYLDGTMTMNSAIVLNTKAGPIYVGNRKDFQDYFEGAVRDISVWNQTRNEEQIQRDMVQWPTLSGNESGLVAYIPLNEGKDNTFSDRKNVIKGTLDNKATWSKPISTNPDPINEGIWFVIQNKADLETDTVIPAKRMALFVNEKNVVSWSAIPLKENYDAFLWRTVSQNGKYYLFNKKLGMTKALDCNLQNPVIGDYGTAKTGQQWGIQSANVNYWGTNVYILSNALITSGKALALDGNLIKVVAKNAAQTNQAWVLQPMEIAIGYHIPVSAADVFPMNQQLDLPYGFKVNATNTSSEWAILNGHLVWKNMLLNLTNDPRNNKNKNPAESWKQIMMISRFDKNSFGFQYPLMKVDKWDEAELANLRGGVRTQTLVTEEMMCRKGVFSRGNKDQASREYDQVVHEFGHTLDYLSGIDGKTFPEPLLGNTAEAQASAVQSWYNNNYSYGDRARTRGVLKSSQLNQFNRLKEFFRESNTWMPPRWLRDEPK